MIPRNIFQTHKSQEYIQSESRLLNATNSWKKDTSFKYSFYNDKQCHDFIEEFFPDIKDAYEKVPLHVMKADIWRYCIIYKYGGIYADADAVLKTDPNVFVNQDGKNFVIFNESDNIHYCQVVFSSISNSPVLKSILDLAVERIRKTDSFTDEHLVHYLTGPGVFTDGIINYCKNKYGNYPERGNLFRFNSSNIDIKIYDVNTYNNYIQHLFSGGWNNGWYQQRNQLFKDTNNNKKLICFGSSSSNTKVIPFLYDSTKKYLFQLCETYYSDSFSFTIDNKNLIIKRTDKNDGWGHDHSVYFFEIPFSATYIEFGTSDKNTKRIPFSGNSNKKYSFELCKNKYNDTFSFSIENGVLNITRTDVIDGWGHNHSVLINEE